MMCRVRARSALALVTAVSAVALSLAANAAELPAIKMTAKNTVPECVTPGRLMGFLEARNKKLDDKFSTIAADYARIGDELQIRWDTAFFQMLLETGNLTFTGDVSPNQNNFAGLGATGKHEPGETFPDVATGVKAHLQHLLMYSGEKLDNPVAERTRKVQEWGVLTAWQKTIAGPMTYQHLARKWAPGSKSYAHDIENVADSFFDGPCKSADPKPELTATLKDNDVAKVPAAKTVAKAEIKTTDTAPEAKAEPGQKVASMEADDSTAFTPPKVSGADLAKRANDEARASGTYVRSGLGAGMLAALGWGGKAAAEPAATDAAAAPAADAATAQPAVKILNAPKTEAETASASAPAAEPDAKVQVAALGAGTKSAVTPSAAAKAAAQSKCKVWTASYGGARAVIIKANADALDNYTVLDVNEGTEQREADAYIAAYAKGGTKVGDFNSSTQALDKAFELCPEG